MYKRWNCKYIVANILQNYRLLSVAILMVYSRTLLQRRHTTTLMCPSRRPMSIATNGLRVCTNASWMKRCKPSWRELCGQRYGLTLDCALMQLCVV